MNSVSCSGGCGDLTQRSAQLHEWYDRRANRVDGGFIAYESHMEDGSIAICAACERHAARRLASRMLATTRNEYEGGGFLVHQATDLLDRAYAGDWMPIDDSGEAA